MVFATTFDIDINVFNFITFKTFKNIYLINNYSNNLVISQFKYLKDLNNQTENNSMYVYKNGYTKIVIMLINNENYIIEAEYFYKALMFNHLTIVKYLNHCGFYFLSNVTLNKKYPNIDFVWCKKSDSTDGYVIPVRLFLK